MRSRRCGRCWKSFESNVQASQHEEAAACDEKALPDFERLMAIQDEPLVQRSQAALSEEDTWWAIFQRLIPDVAERDISALKLEYSPCT
jgi:hypothetical protein